MSSTMSYSACIHTVEETIFVAQENEGVEAGGITVKCTLSEWAYSMLCEAKAKPMRSSKSAA